MVCITVTPRRNSNHARFYPHTGYLGLTPVTIQGTVRTELEEDKQPLDASLIEVRLRCCEAEPKGPGTPGLGRPEPRVLYEVTKTLWAAQNKPFKPLGDWKSNFRLTIPEESHLHGALSSMTFKTWKVWWTLEAIVHHKLVQPFGTRLVKAYPVHLISHAYPPPSKPLAWSNFPREEAFAATTPPLVRYTASTDSDHYGPGQAFSMDLCVERTDVDRHLIIKKLTVEIHRELSLKTTFHDQTPSDSSADSSDEPPLTPIDYVTFRDSVDVDTLPAQAPSAAWQALAHGPPSPLEIFHRKQISHKSSFANENPFFPSPPSAAHSLGLTPLSDEVPALTRSRKEDITIATFSKNPTEIVFNSQGKWSTNISGIIPKAKTYYHWSLGETSNTPGMEIRFYIAVRLVCKTKHATFIELPHRNITFHSTVAEDRADARQQIPKILAVQAAESRLFEFAPGIPKRSASIDSASIEEGSLFDRLDLGKSDAAVGDSAAKPVTDVEEARLRKSRHRFASSVSSFVPPGHSRQPSEALSDMSTHSKLSPKSGYKRLSNHSIDLKLPPVSSKRNSTASLDPKTPGFDRKSSVVSTEYPPGMEIVNKRLSIFGRRESTAVTIYLDSNTPKLESAEPNNSKSADSESEEDEAIPAWLRQSRLDSAPPVMFDNFSMGSVTRSSTSSGGSGPLDPAGKSPHVIGGVPFVLSTAGPEKRRQKHNREHSRRSSRGLGPKDEAPEESTTLATHLSVERRASLDPTTITSNWTPADQKSSAGRRVSLAPSFNIPGESRRRSSSTRSWLPFRRSSSKGTQA